MSPQDAPDHGTQVAAEIAYVQYLFQRADEFYRMYREALLNGERNRDKPRPVEWVPLSEQ